MHANAVIQGILVKISLCDTWICALRFYCDLSKPTSVEGGLNLGEMGDVGKVISSFLVN